MDSASIICIFRNIEVLLKDGVFAGGMAPAIAEAQNFIKQFVTEMEAKDGKTKSTTEAGSGVRGEEGTGRMGDRGVSDTGRKGRKAKAK
jgi:hypothetical protein